MSVYEYKVKSQKGEDVSLSQYKGKVLLIVNTATKCGFTPQYEELEALYEKYHEQGFEVLDFPCNQFFHQAPHSDEEINQICSLKFNTKFPRFKKVDVKGDNAEPLFIYLCSQNEKGKYKEALSAYQKIQNKTRDVNLAIASCYWQMNDYKSANEYYLDILKTEPNNKEVLL